MKTETARVKESHGDSNSLNPLSWPVAVHRVGRAARDKNNPDCHTTTINIVMISVTTDQKKNEPNINVVDELSRAFHHFSIPSE